LTWEWDLYKLRSAIYPSFLSIPLKIIKSLGLDYSVIVKLCPSLAHIFLVIISDAYIWKIGKMTMGTNATRLSFLILIFNRVFNEQIIRTFSNSIETICQTIAFYYFLKVSNKFDKNLIILTTTLTISFMMRNTSPVGWPLVLALKIYRDRSLLPFLMAGVFIFIPVVCLCIAIDCYYFGEFPVFTSYNFMKANITEGLSKYFGT